MILLIHILIALASLIVAAVAFIQPSSRRLRLSYWLTGLTIATGSYLIVSAPAHMLQTCVTGLSYLGIMTVAIVMARHKLANSQV